ncbi:AEC family transporter [Loigolactobacillus binensis]|uniref:AEC family transporter n=1 Tax=Loigolactobacillus binensis TaxID=2559922 RepID=A0ABW3E7T7_9LACO|nr:AEC family transporter [Loigolactobacillus binensis]
MTLSGLTSQVVLMFILMLVGFGVNKFGFMHEQTAADLTNILLLIVSPCLIVNAFEQRFSTQRLQALLFAGLAVLLFYFIQVVLSRLFFRHVAERNLRRIVTYSSIYPNIGFLGIPLASSLFGTNGVFFAVVSLAVFNIFNWSHGVALFREKAAQQSFATTLRKIILNPNIIAIVVGLLIFTFSFQLPHILDQAIVYVSNANTPMAMIVVGNSLADLHFDRQSLNKPILASLGLRNLGFPLLAFGLFKLLGLQGTGLAVSLLLAACPVASIGVLFTLQAHDDPSAGISLMSLSTILSLVTIPLVFAITGI